MSWWWYSANAGRAVTILAAVAVVLVLAWWLLWYEPMQVYEEIQKSDIADALARAVELRDRVRATGAQILLGVAVIAGAVLTWWRVKILERRAESTERQAQAAQEQVKVAQDGQVTERFTRAIEQLGSEESAICLGGIYALERIAKDSERDHPQVMEVLCAFVREETQQNGSDDDPAEPSHLSTTVQAALDVIGRNPLERPEDIRLNLAGVQIPTANLSGAELSGVDLTRADLSKANLSGAKFVDAKLRKTDLSEADLEQADFNGADLPGAVLRGADFSSSNFTKAKLVRADLSEAILFDVNFSEANLKRAIFSALSVFVSVNMTGTNLASAELMKAKLQGENFAGANLSKANLKEATLSKADFQKADLREANLSKAVLQKADLREANLSKAVLWEADLREANLSNANFQKADLSGADLSGADLSNAKHLTRHQIESAQISERTMLPKEPSMKTVTFAVEIYLPRFHELRDREGGRLRLSEDISAVYKEVKQSKEEGFYDVQIEVTAPDHVTVAAMGDLVEKTFGSEIPKTEVRMVDLDDG